MLPAKRAELALAQAGETSDRVERGVLPVGPPVLDVLPVRRPPFTCLPSRAARASAKTCSAVKVSGGLE
jgi:hypothetical protein